MASGAFSRLVYCIIAFVLILLFGAPLAFGQATQVQLRRGTETEHGTFTGAVGEVTAQTTDYRLVLHDGSTAGGYPHALESELVWTKSGSDAYYTAGDVWIGVVAGDGLFHAHSATAGSVTAHADADEIVAENSAAGGISLLVPDASNGNIYFGSASDNDAALLRYNYTNNLLQIGTNRAGGDVALLDGAFNEALRIDGSSNIGIGTASPATRLHLSASTPRFRFRDTQSGVGSLTQTMAGIQLASTVMNSGGLLYTPALMFGSADPDFTTTNPKWLAYIVGEATEGYAADTDAGMGLTFATTSDNAGATPTPTVRMKLNETRMTLTVIMQLTPQASPPASPTDGDVYYDNSGSHALCARINGAWVVLGGAGTCS